MLCPKSPDQSGGTWASFDSHELGAFNSDNNRRANIPLTKRGERASLRLFSRKVMSKVCSITGSKVTRGSIIHRRGMAKKKGGVGRHVTKNVPRTFTPNLHEHRVWVPELRKYVRIKVTARAMKTINKNGAFVTLKKAGLVSAPRTRATVAAA